VAVQGSHDNVDSIYSYLTRNGYSPENILVLTDKPEFQGLNRGMDELNRAETYAYGRGGDADSDSDSSDSDSEGEGYERGAKGKGKKDKGGKKSKGGKKDKGGKKGKGKKDKNGKSGKGKPNNQLVSNNTALGQYINTFAPYAIGLFNHFADGSSGGHGGGGGGHGLGGMVGPALGAVGALAGAGGHGGGGLGTVMNLASNLLPLKNNIMSGFHWLTGSSRSGDSMFVHYVGHGAQARSRDGASSNECIMPLDYQNGMISDEEIHQHLVSKVPEGAKLITLMDCCGSGTGLDLPYAAEARGTKPGKGGVKAGRKQKAHKENQFRSSPGTSICISSVQDGEGYGFGGQTSGQLTYAFLEVMQRHPSGVSYEDMIYEMREIAGSSRGGYSQTPALTFNNTLDLTQAFTV